MIGVAFDRDDCRAAHLMDHLFKCACGVGLQQGHGRSLLAKMYRGGWREGSFKLSIQLLLKAGRRSSSTNVKQTPSHGWPGRTQASLATDGGSRRHTISSPLKGLLMLLQRVLVGCFS